MRRIALYTAGCLLLCSCQKDKGELGTETAKIVSDTAVLKEANAAANEVIRNSTDCDAVKAAFPATNQKLDEVAGKIRTVTGRVTLDALRTQVRTIYQNCP